MTKRSEEKTERSIEVQLFARFGYVKQRHARSQEYGRAARERA